MLNKQANHFIACHIAWQLHLWQGLWLLALCFSIFINAAVSAQVITLPTNQQQKALTALQKTTPQSRLYYVNGTLTVGTNAVFNQTFQPLGSSAKMLIALTTLKMIDEGQIKLDDPFHMLVPDLIDEDTFTVPLVVAHALTETSGFATPAWLSREWSAPENLHTKEKLSPYLIKLRTAGQMAHDDSVGWTLLVAALERISGLDIISLMHKTFLGDAQTSVPIIRISNNSPYPAPFQKVLSLEATGMFISQLAKLTYRNQWQGVRFLSDELYENFSKKVTWMMHPLAPNRTLGMTSAFLGNYKTKNWWSSCSRDTGGTSIISRPENALAYVLVQKTGDCTALHKALAHIKESFEAYLGPTQDLKTALQLVNTFKAPSELGGRYIVDSLPTAWLAAKHRRIAKSEVLFNVEADQTAAILIKGRENITFKQIALYTYQASDGAILALSPYKLGGYFTYKDQTYRKIEALGNPLYVLTPYPWAVLILLTGLIYVRSRFGPAFRRLGQLCILGSVLFYTGVWVETAFWPAMMYIYENPWLAALTRVVTNIGLMMILTVPMIVLSITRHRQSLSGLWALIAPIHILLLMVAAMLLFLLSIAWGVAGEIWPL